MAVTVFEPGNHAVWHQNDAGDWRIAYFDLELPITRERVEKRFKETVVNWARMMEAEGWEPTTKPIPYPTGSLPAATFIQEPGREGERRFYMAARFKRTRPEYVPLDLISQLTEMEPVDQDSQLREFFDQITKLPPPKEA